MACVPFASVLPHFWSLISAFPWPLLASCSVQHREVEVGQMLAQSPRVTAPQSRAAVNEGPCSNTADADGVLLSHWLTSEEIA